MKKLLAMLLALCMVFALCACGQTAAPAADPAPAQADPAPAAEPAAEPVNITLWTYPIGGWGNADTVDALIASFEAANPGITVTVEYLDYTNGDDQVNTALEGGSAPDLIMEGPERLVANWGAKGYMSISPTCGTPPTRRKSTRPAFRPASMLTAPATSTPSS